MLGPLKSPGAAGPFVAAARSCRATWLALGLLTAVACAQDLVLTGARVLAADGARFEDGKTIVVAGGRIHAIVPAAEVGDAKGQRLDLAGRFVIPGLIDLHTHLLLRPYDEKSWDDQVLREALELRTIRATVAARATLEAGFTTIRDLGTEGAGFADVALRDAIAQGLVPGPRIVATTRALVTTGGYGPAGFDPRVEVPQGAQVADGIEGARNAVLGGVKTIEHGTGIGDATLQLMRERGVVLCPTLAASEAMARYAGRSPAAAKRLSTAKAAFLRARAAGVTIACGSDAGVFRHGDNARELELMVEHGMTTAEALRAATATAAKVLGMETELGALAPGLRADLVVLRADPLADVGVLREPALVVKDGVVAVARRRGRCASHRRRRPGGSSPPIVS